MAKKEIFYVRIKDSKQTRKAILEASKEIIVILQRYEMFRRLRDAKLKLMENLSQQFQDIAELTGQMQIDVPKANFKTTKVLTQMREKEDITEDRELEKLEAAISDIERKLHDM